MKAFVSLFPGSAKRTSWRPPATSPLSRTQLSGTENVADERGDPSPVDVPNLVLMLCVSAAEAGAAPERELAAAAAAPTKNPLRPIAGPSDALGGAAGLLGESARATAI